MQDFIEILKYILPSLLMFVMMYAMLKIFLKREERKQQQNLFASNQKTITPIRLQAYERLAVFLERIRPESLIVRENEQSMNNGQLHRKLMLSIKAEFEHNLSQQIYVSSELWLQIETAKEDIIRLINTEAAQVLPADPALDLGKAVIEAGLKQKDQATTKAMKLLKAEISRMWQK